MIASLYSKSNLLFFQLHTHFIPRPKSQHQAIFSLLLLTQGRSKRIIKLCYKVKWMRIFCLYPVPIECESNKNISKHVDDGRGDIVVLCASSCIATKTTEFRYFFLFLFHFFLFISFFFFFWSENLDNACKNICFGAVPSVSCDHYKTEKNCRFRNGWYGTRGGVFYRQHQPAEGGKKNKQRKKQALLARHS